MTETRGLAPPAVRDADERERLESLRRYDVAEAPTDGSFDLVASLAARVFDVPIAVVSIVDEDRIWFKAKHGLDVAEIPRDPGLCASAILRDDPLVIPDARLDPVALTNPLVAGDLGLRFYAGAPLTTADGHNLGTMAIIDRQPREVTRADVALLEDLAQLVMNDLELRLSARRALTRETELHEHAESLVEALHATMQPPKLPEIAPLDVGSLYKPVDHARVGGDFYDLFSLPDGDCGVVAGDVSGNGPEAAVVATNARHIVRASALDNHSPSSVLARLNDTMLIGRNGDEVDVPFCTILFAHLHGEADGYHVSMASGGHPLPRVLRRDGGVETVGEFGTLVGLLTEAEFTDTSFLLCSGDTMVMFTDGLTEARADDGSVFGPEGVEEVLASCAGRGTTEIIEALQRTAFAGARQQRDDLLIFVLKVK